MNTPQDDTLSQDLPIELRVLHGPQAGSRLALMPQESYLLGSGDTCTVMLAGAQVQSEHARLTIDADHWVIDPDQGSVTTLDGQPCGPDRPLELGTVVQLGLVKLTVVRHDARWPQDEALVPQPRPEPDTQLPAREDGQAHADPCEALEDRGAVANASAAPRGHRALAAALLTCVAGSAVALTAYAGWQMTAVSTQVAADAASAADIEPHAAARPSIRDALQTWLAALPESGRLALEGHGDGPWRVVGYVPTEIGRRHIVQSAQSLPWPVAIDILTETEREARVRRFLHAEAGEAIDARLAGTRGATLQVRLVATHRADAERFMQRLRTELRALEPVAFDVLLPSDIRQRFLQGLQDNGLAARFDVVRNEPEFTLRALLPQHEVKRWEQFFSHFTGEYGSVVGIHATVRTERDSVESRIRAVVAGRYPYVITASGERVAPGGQIDGKVLAAIGAQEIVFADGLRLRLHP